MSSVGSSSTWAGGGLSLDWGSLLACALLWAWKKWWWWWESESCLPWYLLPGWMDLRALGLPVTQGGSLPSERVFSCSSPCLDYRRWEQWWEETVLGGDVAQYFLVVPDPSFLSALEWKLVVCPRTLSVKGKRFGCLCLLPWKQQLLSAAALLSPWCVFGAKQDVQPRPVDVPHLG